MKVKNMVSKKYFIIATCLILILRAGHAHAEIQTKQDAVAFLGSYCIVLVGGIKGLYEEQKILVAEEKWKEFFEKGALISAIADIYSKLCK